MVVLTDRNQPGGRRKFIYRDVLLEVSYLRQDQFQSPEQVLSDYHLAPSLRTAKVVFDPLGCLRPLVEVVSREYARRRWVRARCAAARDKVLAALRSIGQQAPLHDQVIACLFAAGITTHVLLAAGLGNPTVRTRYVAARDLLARYGRGEFHGTMLELLGAARLTPQRVREHLSSLGPIFDAAQSALTTSVPFAADISDHGRAISIDGSIELIERGYHREAMFWLGVTHSRCRKILASDAPELLNRRLNDCYVALLGDLGLPAFPQIRRRCAEIERTLPEISDLAESILAANTEIVDD